MQPNIVKDRSPVWRTRNPGCTVPGPYQHTSTRQSRNTSVDTTSPGWFLEEFPESYVAGELQDGKGNKIRGQGRIVVDSTTAHAVFVGKKRVLGGWVAAEVLQPWLI
jgi:hypothetical protein